jgi:hypothetical protein
VSSRAGRAKTAFAAVQGFRLAPAAWIRAGGSFGAPDAISFVDQPPYINIPHLKIAARGIRHHLRRHCRSARSPSPQCEAHGRIDPIFELCLRRLEMGGARRPEEPEVDKSAA